MSLSDLPRPVGYVLGGGSSLGAIQVGMLQALAEEDVLPDLVAGTSIGALNGSVVALEPKSAANRLSHAWSRMTRERAFPGGFAAQARTLQRNRPHLFPNAGLATVIGEFLGDASTFDDLALPFSVVTTDVGTARAHVVKSGPLLPALLASAAVPGIYPPVAHDSLCSTTAASWRTCRCARRSRWVRVHSWCSTAPFPAGYRPPTAIAEVLLYTALDDAHPGRARSALVAEQIPVVYLSGPVQIMSPLDFTTPRL